MARTIKTSTSPAAAQETLRGYLRPDTTIYTQVMTRTQISRTVKVYCVQEGAIRDITGLVGVACECRVETAPGGDWAIRLRGSDGHDLVALLAYRLHGNAMTLHSQKL